jgi:hypothetical protein
MVPTGQENCGSAESARALKRKTDLTELLDVFLVSTLNKKYPVISILLLRMQ